MSNSNINSVIAVLPVTDQSTAVDWYKNLFGRDADIVPMEGVAEWQLADNAWIQVTVDPERAGTATAIIGVDDIEVQCSALAASKVSHGEVVEYPGTVKMVEVLDPDANKVIFVQDISKDT